MKLAAGRAAGPVWRESEFLPQNGSQFLFLRSPVFECLYHGTRGPGKTTGLILDFLQEVGKGYGAAWRGVLFRRSYPELEDVRVKTGEWCRKIRQSARWIAGENKFVFRDGAELLLRFMARPGDYAVNQGPGRAKRFLQRALKVTADGRIGPLTLAAAARADPEDTLSEFMTRRALHYSGLANLAVFGLGWFRRLFDIHRRALALV